MPRITPEASGSQNVCALLDCIASSEIGSGLLAASDDGYNVLVGSAASAPLLFNSYAAHPDVYNPRYRSTAAGRYQLLSRYYAAYKSLLRLPDFGPMSQDRIAIQQIRESHGFDLIVAGQFAQAVASIAHIWASLPGAGYGQHENQLSTLQAAYLAAGGQLSDCEAKP